MVDRLTPSVDTGEIRQILRGAVDLYVHPSPELLPRQIDEITLAKQMRADGFRAAMMWNQFSHTGERATTVSAVTGFDMRGSIILNGTVGGLNPIVTEHAIRMGARYVSMPTMSGAWYQNQMSDYARAAATLAGPVPVVDESGTLLPKVHDIIDLVKRYDVVLGVGYLSYAEAMAVLRAARDQRVRKLGVLRPFSHYRPLTPEQLEDVMAIPGVFLQFPSSTPLRATGAGGTLTTGAEARAASGPAASAIAAAIKRYGADRCVVQSDAGWNDLTALEWLTLACSTLRQEGVAAQTLRTLVRDTPAGLIGIDLAG